MARRLAISPRRPRSGTDCHTPRDENIQAKCCVLSDVSIECLALVRAGNLIKRWLRPTAAFLATLSAAVLVASFAGSSVSFSMGWALLALIRPCQFYVSGDASSELRQSGDCESSTNVIMDADRPH